MTNIESNNKFLYLGDATEFSVIKTGVSSKDLYKIDNIKYSESQMTEREKKGALKITIQLDDYDVKPNQHHIWITRFSKIDKQEGITLRFKRGLL